MIGEIMVIKPLVYMVIIGQSNALYKKNEQSLVNNFNTRINLINNYSKNFTW